MNLVQEKPYPVYAMTRTRLIMWVIVPLFPALMFGALLLPHRSEVTYANLQKIRIGMTVDEVESILGSGRNANQADLADLLSGPTYLTSFDWQAPDLNSVVWHRNGGLGRWIVVGFRNGKAATITAYLKPEDN